MSRSPYESASSSDELRNEFVRRGWSIRMGDNEYATPDPFEVIVDFLAFPTAESDAIRRHFLDELIAVGAVTTAMSYDEINSAMQRLEKHWRFAYGATAGEEEN